jgi:hypothetical protein
MLDQLIEVFRTGDYGPKGTYTQADLDEMIAAFGALPDKPPITLHHDDTKGPHGEVTHLERQGDRLFARLGDLSSEFVGWLKERPYAKRSVEVYPRSSRTGGKLALRALSFVAKPEVQGLAPLAAFHDRDGAFYYAIEFQEERPMPDQPVTFTEVEVAEREAAAKEAARLEAEATFAANLAAREAKFNEDLAAQLARVADLERAQVAAQFAAQREALKAKGVLPAILDRAGIEAFHAALGEGAIAFTEGETEQSVSPRAWFEAFLESLPKAPVGPSVVQAPAPPKPYAFDEDPNGEKLHADATKFAEAKQVTYAEALSRVAAGEQA